MDDKLERKLRKATLDQLGALRLIANSSNATISTAEVREATSTADQSLGGTISAFSRFKSPSGDTLINPVGRDKDKGQLWKLNENVVDKKDLITLLDEIMGEPDRYK